MSIKFIILGCGSSMGVPRADGYSGICDLKNKKNHRTRCSALVKFHDDNILIDTSPDLRHQLLSNKIKSISKVFYTHPHADQSLSPTTEGDPHANRTSSPEEVSSAQSTPS